MRFMFVIKHASLVYYFSTILLQYNKTWTRFVHHLINLCNLWPGEDALLSAKWYWMTTSETIFFSIFFYKESMKNTETVKGWTHIGRSPVKFTEYTHFVQLISIQTYNIETFIQTKWE